MPGLQMVHSANEEGHVHGLSNVASTGVRERLAPLLKLPHVATHDAPHLVLGRPNHGMVVARSCQRWWIKPGSTSEFACRSGSCLQRLRPILVHEMQNRVCHTCLALIMDSESDLAQCVEGLVRTAFRKPSPPRDKRRDATSWVVMSHSELWPRILAKHCHNPLLCRSAKLRTRSGRTTLSKQFALEPPNVVSHKDVGSPVNILTKARSKNRPPSSKPPSLLAWR